MQDFVSRIYKPGTWAKVNSENPDFVHDLMLAVAAEMVRRYQIQVEWD